MERYKNPLSRLVGSEKKLVQNFLVLAASQSINLLIPLLITPFLVAKLGVDRFGVVFFCQVVSIYLLVVIDYHYNLLGVKELAQHRDDPDFVNRLLSRAIATRLLLLLLCSLILFGIANFFPLLQEHRLIAYWSFALLLGQFLLSPWLYQGLGELNALAAIIVISKSCYVISALMFVQNPADYYLPNVLLGGSNAVFGAVGLLYLSVSHRLRLTLPALSAIVGELKYGSHIFASNIAISVYSNTSTVILGLVGEPIMVGYFAVAERLVAVCRGFMTVFFQVTFPRLSHVSLQGRNAIVQLLKSVYVPFTLGLGSLCLGMFFFSDGIAYYFVRANGTPEVARLLKLYSVVPFLVCLNIPFYQLLLIYNHSKAYSSVLIAASVLMVGSSVVLTENYGLMGSVSAIVLTELFVTTSLVYLARMKYQLV